MSDSLSAAVETALGTRPVTDVNTDDQPETPLSRRPSPADEPAKPRKRIDHHIWGSYIILVMVAMIELFSASRQEMGDGNIFDPILRHGGFLAIGLMGMLVLQYIHYRYIFRFIPLYVLFCLGLMIAVRGNGEEINGAVRAIRILGVPLLPAEFMKLGAALGVAWILARFQQKNRRDVSTTGMVVCLIFLLVSAGLLFTQGLSNTIIVVGIGIAMMFVGGMSMKKFIIVLAIIGVCGGVGYYIKTSAKQSPELSQREQLINTLNHTEADTVGGSGRGKVWNERMSNFYRPQKWKEDFSTVHQQEQLSFIAQARGGVSGVGVGRSRENARLPLAYSDYVFAIVVEELGLLGGLFVLLCYMWILGRSAKLTLQFRHTMPGVLIMGCSFVIVFQALYHMCIVSGVIPVSGQPLPLISKGGISVLATSLAFGIMLSCSRHAVRTTDPVAAQRKEHDILPETAQGINPAADN